MTQKAIAELLDFTGKTVCVTGGAMGICHGIAKRFFEAGANVVLADLSEEEGQKTAAALGGKTLFIKTDMSSEADVKNLVWKTVEMFGGLDVFVNNAGIFPSRSVLDMDLEFWEKTQAVNLRGVFLGCREAARAMGDRGGSIVNIASIDALHPSMVGLAAYDASKHGVWGFTKNFALELADKHIRVNAIAPGGISTEGVADMMKGAAKETLKEFEAKVPLGRFGQPDDIATAALFLASDASGYMTGSMVVVNGGVLLK